MNNNLNNYLSLKSLLLKQASYITPNEPAPATEGYSSLWLTNPAFTMPEEWRAQFGHPEPYTFRPEYVQTGGLWNATIPEEWRTRWGISRPRTFKPEYARTGPPKLPEGSTPWLNLPGLNNGATEGQTNPWQYTPIGLYNHKMPEEWRTRWGISEPHKVPQEALYMGIPRSTTGFKMPNASAPVGSGPLWFWH